MRRGTPPSLGGLRVATLNIHGGLRWKQETLRRWMVDHQVDILCLTECGDAGSSSLQGPGLYVSQTSDDPSLGGCAILVAPWHQRVRQLVTYSNGAFVAVEVMLQTLPVTVAAAYAPHSPLKRPELARAFWTGLTTAVEALPRPMVLGMDANYRACIHDTSTPDAWQDVETRLAEIAEFWTVTGLLDTHRVLNPGAVAHTFFAVKEASPLDMTNWYTMPPEDLKPFCRASSRIDVIAASELLLDGASSTVLPTSPVSTDHRPVIVEFPATSVWASPLQSRNSRRQWMPNFSAASDTDRLDYFQTIESYMRKLETHTTNLTIEEFADTLTEALHTAARETLPGMLRGSGPGHSHFIQTITAYRRHLAKLKHVASNPNWYRERHSLPWPQALAKFAKSLTYTHTQATRYQDEAPSLKDQLRDISPRELQTRLLEIGKLAKERTDATPTASEWAELTRQTEDLLEDSMTLVTAYFSSLKKDWMPVLSNLADATFAKSPRNYIQNWL